MSDNSNSTYKQLVTVLPLIGAFLVFLGLLKLDIYYSHFNINIVDYIDFSEILTSFLDDINIFLFCIIIMVIYTTLGSALFTQLMTKMINKSRERKINKDTIKRSLIQKIKRPLGIIISIIVTGIGFGLLFYFQKPWILIIVTLFSFQLILQILDLINSWTVKVNVDILYKPAFVLLFFLLTYTMAQLEIIRVETHPDTATITTDTEAFATSKDKVLIGKTDKYFFIHNKLTNSNQIIPTARLKILTIEKNKKQ